MAGDVGSSTLKRFTFIGEIAAWVYACERLGTRWTGCRVVANGTAKNDSDSAFVFRLRAAATMAKTAGDEKASKPTLLWEIISSVGEAETDEWMYQLENQEGKDPYRHYNLAMQLFYRGNFDGVADKIAAGRSAVREQSAAEASSAMEQLYRDLEVAAEERPEKRHELFYDAVLSRSLISQHPLDPPNAKGTTPADTSFSVSANSIEPPVLSIQNLKGVPSGETPMSS